MARDWAHDTTRPATVLVSFCCWSAQTNDRAASVMVFAGNVVQGVLIWSNSNHEWELTRQWRSNMCHHESFMAFLYFTYLIGVYFVMSYICFGRVVSVSIGWWSTLMFLFMVSRHSVLHRGPWSSHTTAANYFKSATKQTIKSVLVLPSNHVHVDVLINSTLGHLRLTVFFTLVLAKLSKCTIARA